MTDSRTGLLILATPENTLAHELSFLFREDVDVESVEQREFGGATLSVAVMSFADLSSQSNDRSRYRQTVILLEDGEFDLPEFSLAPKPKGILSVALKLLGDFGTIEFDDPPGFAEQYLLQALAVDATRVFFNRSIREHFAERPGWSVRGKRHALVVFRKNHVCDESEVQAFATEALEMMTLFQVGEEELDEHPELARDVGPKQLMEASQSMGGLAGTILANRLNKELARIKLTSNEVDEFIRSPIPRTIPVGMSRQVLGPNFPLVIVGLVFIVAGLIAGTTWLLAATPLLKPLALGFYLMLPGIGSLMTFGTLSSRRKKNRTMRQGEVLSGRITKVKKTGLEVNHQREYRVDVAFELEGESRVSHVTVNDADRARELQRSKSPIRLLVDPQDADNIVVIDLLILFD
ncbi:MAG: hypothetical protein AAFU85_25200 [Planctomycetota bacterium]